MAPEIAMREPDYNTHSTDIFSMGVVLFIMIAKGKPFGTSELTDKLIEYVQFFEFRKIRNLCDNLISV